MKERESRQLLIANLKQYLVSQTSIYERRLDSNQYRQKIINERSKSLIYLKSIKIEDGFFCSLRNSIRTKFVGITSSTKRTSFTYKSFKSIKV
jgi:CRISPR/Cas system CSM-associated protein Csm5 (group 7 of RAMP superfamily)